MSNMDSQSMDACTEVMDKADALMEALDFLTNKEQDLDGLIDVRAVELISLYLGKYIGRLHEMKYLADCHAEYERAHCGKNLEADEPFDEEDL